ncbi:hypothetical protein FISHEDRAFT_56413 [Fistulina hepatica ATCC 64428]|uniref:F-box domain-containing protein n=1 Tax=Fistulina hepatica ATCC 64428 TaxID=1128425 RepID=A0A0D7AJI6_9AGAR|nr:hypothetical protein FISHEDRAFT_56413 [Fistulina hepatica ATCC 64428]
MQRNFQSRDQQRFDRPSSTALQFFKEMIGWKDTIKEALNKLSSSKHPVSACHLHNNHPSVKFSSRLQKNIVSYFIGLWTVPPLSTGYRSSLRESGILTGTELQNFADRMRKLRAPSLLKPPRVVVCTILVRMTCNYAISVEISVSLARPHVVHPQSSCVVWCGGLIMFLVSNSKIGLLAKYSPMGSTVTFGDSLRFRADPNCCRSPAGQPRYCFSKTVFQHAGRSEYFAMIDDYNMNVSYHTCTRPCMDDLPTELVHYILLLAAPGEHAVSVVSSCSFMPFASPHIYSLPYVCTRWRDICLTESRLLSSLNISNSGGGSDYGGTWTKERVNAATQVDAYLEAVTARLISVSFSLNTADPAQWRLVQSAERWKSARIGFAGHVDLQLSATALPWLEALEFTNEGGVLAQDSHDSFPLHLFASAPQLKSVVFDKDLHPNTFMIPWSQLQEVAVTTVDPLPWFSILTECPLRTLSMSVSRPAGENSNNGILTEEPSFKFPYLRTLVLDIDEAYFHLLGFLCAPQLAVLSVVADQLCKAYNDSVWRLMSISRSRTLDTISLRFQKFVPWISQLREALLDFVSLFSDLSSLELIFKSSWCDEADTNDLPFIDGFVSSLKTAWCQPLTHTESIGLFVDAPELACRSSVSLIEELFPDIPACDVTDHQTVWDDDQTMVDMDDTATDISRPGSPDSFYSAMSLSSTSMDTVPFEGLLKDLKLRLGISWADVSGKLDAEDLNNLLGRVQDASVFFNCGKW